MTSIGSSTIVEKDGAKIRKASPLRATMPLQAMHRTSPLRLRNRISPETEFSPCLDLCSVSGKGRVWTESGSGRGGDGSSSCSVHMRRTASLDAIYLKGRSPTEPFQSFTHLLLNKATQTPEEWVACSLAEVMMGCPTCVGESSGTNTCQTSGTIITPSSNAIGSRRQNSVSSSPWPSGTAGPQSTTNPMGENMEKFIRQRLQRNNKESGLGSRSSPVQADHSVLPQSPVLSKPTVCIQANGAPKGGYPLLPRPLLPRLRNSAEELNQEIERLVLKSPQQSPDDSDSWCSSQQDGRKAPIPEYFRLTRSVNTQTPGRCSSTGGSSNGSFHTTPSLSPPPGSPPLSHVTTPPPDSPAGMGRFPLASFAASPHINRFLAREPPDGCERVSLKPSEEISLSGGAPVGVSWPPIKPMATFTLLPSLGSAFCAPASFNSTNAKEEEGGIANEKCRSYDRGQCHLDQRASQENFSATASPKQ